ncbi:MAG: helix-turn-helix domain-containing protein, partial [Bacteroidota bacterium]
MVETESSVPALERGIKLLDLLAMNKDGFSFGEIFQKIDIPRASLFRILGKLKEYGYVYQEFTTNKYMLGFKIVDLSSIVLKKFDIRMQARPFLQRLVSQTGESAELVIIKQAKLFMLDRIDSI